MQDQQTSVMEIDTAFAEIAAAKDAFHLNAAFNKAVQLVRSQLPRQASIMTPVNQHWGAFETYQPRVLRLQDIYKRNKESLRLTSEFANLLSDVANYLWEKSLLDDGIEAARLAVSILDLDTNNSFDRAQARTLEGAMALEKGFSGRDIGLQMMQEALDIRKKAINSPPPGGTPEEQLLYANAWNDFGVSLLEWAEYEAAEKFLLHALDIKKRNTNKGSEPMEFAEAYMNLAMVRSYQNRHAEAKDLLAEAVGLAEKANDQHSAATQNFTFYWATILLVSGDVEQAKEKHGQILGERKTIFGVDSLRTRHSHYAVGVACQRLGQIEEAEYVCKI